MALLSDTTTLVYAQAGKKVTIVARNKGITKAKKTAAKLLLLQSI